MEEGEGSDVRRWDKLIPDALALIFNKLPLEDKLCVIPGVCKAWGTTVESPLCWQDIDLHEWSTRCYRDLLQQMLQLLLPRSSGCLRSLHVTYVHDDQALELIAQHAGSLERLIVRSSFIHDSILEKLAGKFSTIKVLGLLQCPDIGTRGLEAIGKSCHHLSAFGWSVYPRDSFVKPSHTDEVYAIAKTMPKLKHLTLGCLRIDMECILAVISGCPELEYLNLSSCWGANFDSQIIMDKFPKLKFLGPKEDSYEDEYYENLSSRDVDGWSDCDD